MSSQCYIELFEIGGDQLSESSSCASVSVGIYELTDEIVSNYNIIVRINFNHEEIVQMLNFCHSVDMKLMVAQSGYWFGEIFCDIGTKHMIYDATVECPLTVMIQIKKPDYVDSDCAKYDFHQQMNVFFFAIDERTIQGFHVPNVNGIRARWTCLLELHSNTVLNDVINILLYK